MSETKSYDPLGFVNFDDLSGKNNELEIRVPFNVINRVHRGQYVLIGAGGSNQPYLGRVIMGPFYTPDAVSKDSAFARTSILMADEVPFLPDNLFRRSVEYPSAFRISSTASSRAIPSS